MYDYLNESFEELQELLSIEFINDANWAFTEAFESPIWSEISYLQ